MLDIQQFLCGLVGPWSAVVRDACWKISLRHRWRHRQPRSKHRRLPVSGDQRPVHRTFSCLCHSKVILEKTIRIPRSLSVKAASILKGFLNKNPADRLGCHRDSGFGEIMNHPFFKVASSLKKYVTFCLRPLNGQCWSRSRSHLLIVRGWKTKETSQISPLRFASHLYFLTS